MFPIKEVKLSDWQKMLSDWQENAISDTFDLRKFWIQSTMEYMYH